MAKNLLIVESPAKAKTISKYLGTEFIVEASVGHVKDLPKNPRDPSGLGIDIENGYVPQYKIIKGRKEVLNKLKALAEKVEKIFIATDPDREGEAIAWHIKTEIADKNPNIKRVLFTEITQTGIKSGMSNPRDIDMNLVNAQQARRVLDRIVGYKVSPFLKKVIDERMSLSAGRVQSVALRLVCEREEEIRNFKPEEYWTIEAEFKTETGEVFTAKLSKINGEEAKIPDHETAEKIVEDLRGKEFKIWDIVRKEVRKNPPPPFITSTLQQEAINKLKFSSKKTMMLAQQLYEGVDLGDEGRVGLITYMRTDSTRISNEAISAVREYIDNNFGKEYLPENPRVFKKSKVSQDAHEAIRPTYMKYEPSFVRKYLSQELYALYELIWNRFVASQMSSAILEQTSVDIVADNYLFRATGSVVKFRGYMQIYEEAKVSENEESEEKTIKIPANLSVGDILRLTNIIPEQHFTKPPARYSEASLVKELESRGIGRPSTYATILSTIVERGYVELRDRKLVPTELGFAVNKILVSNFPEIFDYNFTAEMEEDLDSIASGKTTYFQVVDGFYKRFIKNLDKVESRRDEIRETIIEKTDFLCVKCNSPMLAKIGRYGKFLVCSNDECRHTMAFPVDGELKERKVCKECGSDMVLKNGRFGKFYSCSKYPECKYVEPCTIGIKCPECGEGELVERKTKRRKTFYSCSRYPECKFSIWDKPVDRQCPECGYKIMVKLNRKSSPIYKCPKCGATQQVEETLTEEKT